LSRLLKTGLDGWPGGEAIKIAAMTSFAIAAGNWR